LETSAHDGVIASAKHLNPSKGPWTEDNRGCRYRALQPPERFRHLIFRSLWGLTFRQHGFLQETPDPMSQTGLVGNGRADQSGERREHRRTSGGDIVTLGRGD